MTMSDDRLELPSYLDHTPEVRERIETLKNRPVVMSVEGLTRDFDSGGVRTTALSRVSFEVTTIPSPQRAWWIRSPSR